MARQTTAQKIQQRIKIEKRWVAMAMAVLVVVTYFAWIAVQPKHHVYIGSDRVALPIPNLNKTLHLRQSVNPNIVELYEPVAVQTAEEVAAYRAAIRAERVIKVENFFASYGSNMAGYGYILVDQAAACGGDYSILVGIAGSESGLGRINYKLYNPFGYLDGVQYASYEEALTVLSCRISEQHIAPCGKDLYCLANRYAGPSDDLQHFIDKVAWFQSQVL